MQPMDTSGWLRMMDLKQAEAALQSSEAELRALF